MPPSGRTTVRKATWLNLFALATEKFGEGVKQDDVISWVRHNDYLWRHIPGGMPADSTCKGYLRELAAARDESWLDLPWSISKFYSQPQSQELIPYDRLKGVMILWKRVTIGGNPFTCRQAVWVARLLDFFDYEEDIGQQQMYEMAVTYSSRERAANATGKPFDSSGLDAKLAFIHLSDHGALENIERNKVFIEALARAGQISSTGKLDYQESLSSMIRHWDTMNDLTSLEWSEAGQEFTDRWAQDETVPFRQKEPWKTDLFLVVWRALGGPSVRDENFRESDLMAGRLRDLVDEERWDELREWMGEVAGNSDGN